MFSRFIRPTTSRFGRKLAFGAAGVGALTFFTGASVFARSSRPDYEAIRRDIAENLEQKDYDDGSIGPVLVRLAWHAAGTFDKADGSGGSNGAKMRFEPESLHGGNAGLHHARAFLEPFKEKYPELSYADLWTLAGTVAIEEMGGPKMKWTGGRSDEADGKKCTPDGRLPDAAQGAQHVRDVFYRMGFDDREIVALLGAHCLGRCHTDRSGFHGPWTRAPTTFSNLFFKELLENKWEKKNWNGPLQYTDPSGELMMLPADLALRDDPAFRKYVELYAKDEKAFFDDFAKAWPKLMNLGWSPSAGGGSDDYGSTIGSFFLIALLGLASSKK
jgi:cytochrome c peroxidase